MAKSKGSSSSDAIVDGHPVVAPNGDAKKNIAKADTVATDYLRLWHDLFDEPTKNQLRRLTNSVRSRLAHSLNKLFVDADTGGWESWLLHVCRDPMCASGLGIPSHYGQGHLAQLLTRGTGLSASHADAVRTGLHTSLRMLRKVLYHDLCPVELRRFREAVDSLDFSLCHSNGTGLSVGEATAANLRNHPKSLASMEYFAKLRQLSLDSPTRGKYRSFLRSFRAAGLDAEFYALLLAIEQERYRITDVSSDESLLAVDRENKVRILLPAYTELRQALADIVMHTDSIDSDVVKWWIMAELLSVVGQDDLNSPPLRDAVNKLVDLLSGTAVASAGSELSEYVEVPSMSQILCGISALAIRAFSDFRETIINAQADLTRRANLLIAKTFAFLGSDGNDGRRCDSSPVKQADLELSDAPDIAKDDGGRLSAMSVRMLGLLEYWKWQALYETKACIAGGAYRSCRNASGTTAIPAFGTKANTPRANKYLCWPLWNALKDVPRRNGADNKFTEWMARGGIAGTDTSVFLLGAAGVGKGAIVDELWAQKLVKEADANVIRYDRTPYEMKAGWDKEVSDNFRGTFSKLPAQRWPQLVVLFIDEIHLPSNPPAFGLLLKPLQEGMEEMPKDYSERVFYVFGSSAYRSKEEFDAAVAKSEDIAGRDFGTRIGHWISLPELATIVEQKYLVVNEIVQARIAKEEDFAACRSVKCNIAEALAASFAIRLSCGSVRDLKRDLDRFLLGVAGKDADTAVATAIARLAGIASAHYPVWASANLVESCSRKLRSR